MTIKRNFIKLLNSISLNPGFADPLIYCYCYSYLRLSHKDLRPI